MSETFVGKRIHIWGAGPSTCEPDIRARISNLNLNLRDCLRFFGSLDAILFPRQESVAVVRDVPVQRNAIAYLALLLVLECTDNGVGSIDGDGLASLVHDYHNMEEADLADDLVFEYLIRLGQSQFSFQHYDVYAIPRTLLTFGHIWPSKKRGDLPRDIVREVTGFELEHLLLFSQSFSGMARAGYVSLYGEASDSDHPVHRLFTRERQAAFLERFSADYATIRATATRGEPSARPLLKYRSNPLFLYPLVKPDILPPIEPPVYLVPCPQLLLSRVTDGLVFDCHRRFGHSFDEKFGFVVEEYVGMLLRKCCSGSTVRGEFSYVVDGHKYKSPDWLVIDNGRAVVIEVKKSILRGRARAFGRTEDVKKDLSETLLNAKEQLCRFRAHLVHINGMPHLDNVELVTVSWDEIWWANSILQRESPDDSSSDVVHAMTIKELERLVARSSSSSLYDLLWAKRLASKDDKIMDFGDWMAHHAPATEVENTFLTAVRDEFWSRWKLPTRQ